jgi:hypothetical protein
VLKGSEVVLTLLAPAMQRKPGAVTARKDDAPAAVQAAMANVAGWCWISGVGGLILTTSG